MQNRFQKVLRRIGVGLLSILVVVLMLAEDVLLFAGFLVRKILPANFEEFLKRQSAWFAFGIVAISVAIYIALHFLEYAAFWWGYWWTGTFLLVISKIYTVSVLGYLCRVYSDRLLAVAWIRKSWRWYLASKEFLKSFEWYRVAHAHVVWVKERVKRAIRRLRERPKGHSLFSIVWRLIRLRRRH